jgi:hypothetical protein
MKTLTSLALLAVVACSQAVVWQFTVEEMQGFDFRSGQSTFASGNAVITIDTDNHDVFGAINVQDLTLNGHTVYKAVIEEAPFGSNNTVCFDVWGNLAPGNPVSTGDGDFTAVFVGSMVGTEEERNSMFDSMVGENTYLSIYTQVGNERNVLRGQVLSLGAVPEPGTFAAIGLGLAALASRRRRK